MKTPYGMLYHTHLKRIVGPPIRPATRDEWLASIDKHGWPTHMIDAIAEAGYRTVAIIGGPHRENDPEECTCNDESQCGLCSTGRPDGQRFAWGRA